METFHTFGSAEDARTYRHEHGTGGWIFVPSSYDGGPVVLFPPHYPPSKIMNHAFTKGRTGDLIGCG